jgi:hypothetical protein
MYVPCLLMFLFHPTKRFTILPLSGFSSPNTKTCGCPPFAPLSYAKGGLLRSVCSAPLRLSLSGFSSTQQKNLRVPILRAFVSREGWVLTIRMPSPSCSFRLGLIFEPAATSKILRPFSPQLKACFNRFVVFTSCAFNASICLLIVCNSALANVPALEIFRVRSVADLAN